MDGQVIIEGTRRRVWPEAVKRGIVAESYDPDVTVIEVGRRHDLDPAQIYQWRKRYPVPDWMRSSERSGDGFVAMEVVSMHGKTAPSLPSGTVLPFPSHEEPEPSRRMAGAGPTGPSDDGLDEDRIEAMLPDGVVLRLPGDVAADRLAELVNALREARP